MANYWLPRETSTHQDHVIAHVIGATVLGYFVHDEALHLVLDIGFIWTVYIDCQMQLLPQVVAIAELELHDEARTELKGELELLASGKAELCKLITACPVYCLITEVSFFANEDRRRLLLKGEKASLVILTSLSTAEIEVRSED